MSAVKKHAATMEATLQTLGRQDEKYRTALAAALTEYAKLAKRAEDIDPAKLEAVRKGIHTTKSPLSPDWAATP